MENVIDNYITEIKQAKNINELREVEHKMFKNDNLEDNDLGWVIDNELIPKIKKDFGIDLLDIAQKLEISTYELILRIF